MLYGPGAGTSALTELASNAGSLIMEGSTLSTPGSFNNSGDLTFDRSPNFSVNGDLNNTGNVTANAGGTTQLNVNHYVQTGSGSSTQVYGTMMVPDAIINGGYFHMQMTFVSSVLNGNLAVNSGTFEAGEIDSGSNLTTLLPTINGNFTVGAGGTYLEGMFGDERQGWERLDVNGNVTLAGTLDLNFYSSDFDNGEMYLIMSYNAETGQFSTVTALPSGETATLDYAAGALYAEFSGTTFPPVPEPGTIGLFGIGLVAAGWRLKRKKGSSAARREA
jgi:hypothetical protein